VILSAIVREDGIRISTVEIDDPVWGSAEPEIRDLLTARGMDVDVEPQPGRFEIERRCSDLAAVRAWTETLNVDED